MSEPEPEFTPDWVSPPGDTILDILVVKGWCRLELASHLEEGVDVDALIDGRAVITEQLALQLAMALGGTAVFWITREAHYRAALARREGGA